MKRLSWIPAAILILISCHQVRKKSESSEFKFNISLKWSTDSVFKCPESVFYDKERNLIYVSNINGDPSAADGNGFMSKLDTSGNIIQLHWISGLNAPKGMDVYNGNLFVADITRIAEINLADDSLTAFYANRIMAYQLNENE